MIFNSIQYGIFLPIVFIIYWSISHKYRWIFLLISSYYFYMSWNVKYVVLILFITGISFAGGIIIDHLKQQKKKRLILILGISISIILLFVFKYFDFFNLSFCNILQYFTINLHPVTLNLILPVGISFYTFQAIGYMVDVYRGDVRAEKHFGIFATFISFFPQLVAGPIERTSDLLPQIKKEKFFNYEQAVLGMKLIVWGLFKKILIADVVAPYVDVVYNDPVSYNGFALLLASLLFTIQIYCDFSGYSDIAIGSAKLLGIELMTNFSHPYFSRSIREFWKNWHISLSSWFQDYVYISLGGNQKGNIRKNINTLLTFGLSGLWHGANWTYVFWGGVHGIAQIFENEYNLLSKSRRFQYKKLTKNLFDLIRCLGVFVFVSFAWIFFRANTISDAFYILRHMFDGITNPYFYIWTGFSKIYLHRPTLLPLICMILVLTVYDYAMYKGYDVMAWISKRCAVFRHIIYIVIVLCLLAFRSAQEAQFVYFQF